MTIWKKGEEAKKEEKEEVCIYQQADAGVPSSQRPSRLIVPDPGQIGI